MFLVRCSSLRAFAVSFDHVSRLHGQTKLFGVFYGS